VKTEHVWQSVLETAVSKAIGSKAVLGHELSFLLCHLEINGASLVRTGLHLSYPASILARKHLSHMDVQQVSPEEATLSPGLTYTAMVSTASSSIMPCYSRE